MEETSGQAGCQCGCKDILKDSLKVLTSPKSFFAAMPQTGGYKGPLLKAVVYGFLAGIITYLLTLAQLAPGGRLISIVISPIFAVIVLFIAAVILLLISLICGGSRDFQAAVRVEAALMVLYPLQALAGVVVKLGFTAMALTGLILGLYGLFLFYQGLVQALAAKPLRAKIVSIIFGVLLTLLFVTSISAHKMVPAIQQQMSQEMQEQLKNNETMAKEMEAKMQDLMEQMKTQQNQ